LQRPIKSELSTTSTASVGENLNNGKDNYNFFRPIFLIADKFQTIKIQKINFRRLKSKDNLVQFKSKDNFKQIFNSRTMDPNYSILIVFLTGVAELWLAIPLGLVLKLSPLSTAVTAALGSVTSALIVAFAGSNLRSRFLKWRYGSDENLKKGRYFKIWNKYGVVGLGILSPLLFGAPLGTAVGIIFGAERNRLLLWIIIGIIIWSAGLTAAVYLGTITIYPEI